MSEKYHTAGAKLKHCKIPLMLVSSLLVLLLSIFTGISLTHAATITYTYDNLHRLSKVDYGNGMVIDYTYDAAGNRTSEIVSAGSVNTVPALSYSSEPGYGSDGVNPDSGTASTTFTYKVIYTDANNNPPASIKVHIDGDVSGISMSVDSTAVSILRDGNYTNGEQYYYTTYSGAGTHNYYFDASDGTDSARLPSIGILNGPAVSDHINNPPSLIPIGAKSVNEGANLNFTISGSDPDGDLLTYSATGLPTGATFDVNTLTFNWTPDFTQSGSYSVTFAVSDGSGTASETLTITVNDVNDATPPITTASPAGGTYTSSQNVVLSANEPATIYYTTDSTTPTNSSPVYSGPINISTTTTIKFFAVDNAGNNEVVKTATYTILSGLLGEYYNNSDLTVPVMTRIDSAVNFDWGTGSPGASIDPDSFSVRWSGKLKVDNNEIYTFHAITDDGIRLWIDGHLVLNYWKPGGVSTSDTMDLISGLHDIKIEFYEDTGSALAQLYWSSSSTLYGIIPNDHLQPPAGAGSPPVLVWANDTGYVSDGVEPQTGDTATLFTYRVKYTDADGDSPMTGYPRVHILKGGKDVSGSPFVMNYESGDNTSGAMYGYTVLLPVGIDYTYYFDAMDSMGLQAIAVPVEPTPVAPVDAPDVCNNSQNTYTLIPTDDIALNDNGNVFYDGGIQTVNFAWTTWSYLKFDLSSIPSNDQIVSVKFGVYEVGDWFNLPEIVNLHYVNYDSWNETGITWATKPVLTQYLGQVTAPVGGNQWHVWDIPSQYITTNIADGFLSLALTDGVTGPWHGNSLASTEQFPSLGLRPYLEIVTSDSSVCTGINNNTTQLPRTGQTTCYDAGGAVISCTGTGQDGEIKAGVLWPYPRFADSGSGTLTDNLTGLMWTKDANLMTTRNPEFDKDVIFGDGSVTWQHALDYVAKLNAEAYLGYTDWRLPNINELESLVNVEQVNTADWLYTQGFINVTGYTYWSSTSNANYPDNAWVVFMGNGRVNGFNKSYSYTYYNYKVWPLRSGQTAATIPLPKTGQKNCYDTIGAIVPCAGTGQDGDTQSGVSWPIPLRFIDNANGTVIDNFTGLMWTRDTNLSGTVMTWLEALNYVKGMNTGIYPNLGYTDWRLPNRKELLSLIDHSKYGPALPTGHPFINVQIYGYYWSSTSYSYDRRFAWIVGLGSDSSVGTGDKSSNIFTYTLWPVRSGLTMAIDITKSGTGSGIVSSSSAGIDCGTDCTETYSNGDTITLTAFPDAGSVFTGWGGDLDCIDGVVTMDTNKTCIATFVKTWFEENDPAITYTGTWSNYTCAPCSSGVIKISNKTGAKATFTFNGTGFKWIAAKANQLGKAKVYVDGVYTAITDLFSTTNKIKQIAAQVTGLTPGNHTITIVVSGQKNTSSTGYYIDIDAFGIMP